MPDAIPSTVPSVKLDAYGVFSGNMDQLAVQRLFSAMTNATDPSKNVRSVHILFQSQGGSVNDSICLYNFFKAYTVDLTLYNSGSLASGAVIAFLGAKKRKASARATFMIHRTTGTPQAATSESLHAIADSVAMDDVRTAGIFREHIRLTEEHWQNLNKREVFFSPEEALTIGIIDEIAEFTPPFGTQIFYI